MDNYKNIARAEERWIIWFLLLVLLSSCSIFKPRVIEKIRDVHDTTYVHHRDSIFQYDSIYVKEWLKGDTVYIKEFRDRYIYKDRWRDSIQVKEMHDTTTVQVEVEKKLSPIQKAKINSFWYLVLALAGFAVWTFRKPILNLIKTIV